MISVACAGACSLQALPAELQTRIWQILTINPDQGSFSPEKIFSPLRALSRTCRAFRSLWLTAVVSLPWGSDDSAQARWRQDMAFGAALKTGCRNCLSQRWLLKCRGPEDCVHPLLQDEYWHLEGVLHLNERALRYLVRQQPEFLEEELGPAFADRCANYHKVSLYEEQHIDIEDHLTVISLTLVHHYAVLQPHEVARLADFVRRMPRAFRQYEDDVDVGSRIASCCYLKGQAGQIPLYWEVDPLVTYHRDL